MIRATDYCERCHTLTRHTGDNLCQGCADFLGRDTTGHFWGDFAAHPDSKLRVGSEVSRGLMFVGVIDELLERKRA